MRLGCRVGYAHAVDAMDDAANLDPAVPAPDLTRLDDGALRDEIHRLTVREREISFQRRYLHGQIELVRNELMRRLAQQDVGELRAIDIEELNRILDGPGSG